MERLVKRYRWYWAGLILLGVAAAVFHRWQDQRQNGHDPLIRAAAQRYGVSPALIKAVIWRESRFNPRARGGKNEVGLMQLRELAGREWADSEKLASFQLSQLYDPEQNVLAGTWYLKKLLRRYAKTDNPIPYALADYNAGRRHVLRWNEGPASTQSAVFLRRIDFPTTKAYINAVLDRYEQYQTTFTNHLVP